MKKYIDLFNELKKLTPEQLECDIKLLFSDNELIEKDIRIILDENPLYIFNDTNNNEFFAFEDVDIAEEYKCIKILDSKYPIIAWY